MKDDCIFCKLANGVIPTNSIYEDDDFKVIMDANPVSKGHALILPKEHYADIYDVDEAVAEKMYPLAKKLAKKMKEVLNCDGVNVLQNTGEAAGQSVFHIHMHVIPRYKDAKNNEKLLGFVAAGLSEDEIKEIAEALR
ncbi:MAG: HIT domain-containing protein [Lachnospiraceae bacterium]|nr:HIT domain-containing protein [Lachnospiraceae bacterium]